MKRKMHNSLFICAFNPSLLPKGRALVTCFKRNETRFILGATEGYNRILQEIKGYHGAGEEKLGPAEKMEDQKGRTKE